MDGLTIVDRDLVGTLSISTPRRSLLSTDSFSPPYPEGGSDSRFIFYRSAKERKKAYSKVAFSELQRS